MTRAAFHRPARRLLLFVALTLSACATDRPPESLATRWLDAMNAHRADLVLALLAPDVTYIDPVTSVPVGREKLAERLRAEWGVYHDQVYTAKRIHETPDAAVVEWTVQETHPSGKHIEIDGVTVLSTQGGSIHALRSYFNPIVFLQFLP
jgi:steroid delta-isomerase-like uncharacterized protein